MAAASIPEPGEAMDAWLCEGLLEGLASLLMLSASKGPTAPPRPAPPTPDRTSDSQQS